MPDMFDITTIESPRGTVVIRVSGQLDAKSAPVLLSRSGLVRGDSLVVNLAAVSFIASSGVGALLALVEQFRERGGVVRFVALSSAVDSVIRLLNLDQFLTIDPTEDDAVAALEG